MAEIEYISGDQWETEVTQSELPVLVDFNAEWCAPCKMIAPIIEQLAEEWQGRVKVVQMNADQNPDIMVKYGIMGIPTVILFKNGDASERITGYMPKDKLVDKLAPHL